MAFLSQWWTAEQDAQLEAGWTEGLTLNVIAERLHCTRNAVAGRRKRLGLPGRASPIVRTATPKPKPPPRVVVAVAPVQAVVLPETRRGVGGRDIPATWGGAGPARVPIRGATLAGVDAAAVAAAVGRPDAPGCRYIAGEPRPVRAGMFCDAPVWRGVYCAECWAKCYQRVSVGDREAAD